MTQALNLANFANNLNTAGATSNAGLQNSSITVTAGTGLSGGGTPALGGSVTLNNAGVTSVAAGTGISVSASTGGVTITNTSPGTTYTAGTGISISGGVITNTAPNSTSFNTVGSYVQGWVRNQGTGTAFYITSGNTYPAGSYQNAVAVYSSTSSGYFQPCCSPSYSANLSGTWRWMGPTAGTYGGFLGICVRIS